MEVNKIVIVDLWTDSNRGDNALQCGLIAMVRDRWPKAIVQGVFRFGINEFDLAREEVSNTCSELDFSYGGLRSTFYSNQNMGKYKGWLHIFVTIRSFCSLFFVLVFYKIGFHRLIPQKKLDVINVIKNADVVIWKGKNFRSYGGIAGINRQMTLLIAGVIALSLRKDVYCLNASVWNMKYRFERWLVKNILGRCVKITVRDKDSLINLKDILNTEKANNVYMAQDLAFYAVRKIADGIFKKKITNKLALKRVALTITSWGEEEEQRVYVDTLKNIVIKCLKLKAVEFVIVPQVTRAVESNEVIVSRLEKAMPNVQFKRIDGNPSIEQLLKIYSKCDLLIGTRMHSCVFARAVNTPFIAIAYDVGPKWKILNEFWPDRFVFDYVSDSADILKSIDELVSKAGDITLESQHEFDELAFKSFYNVEIIK